MHDGEERTSKHIQRVAIGLKILHSWAKIKRQSYVGVQAEDIEFERIEIQHSLFHG